MHKGGENNYEWGSRKKLQNLGELKTEKIEIILDEYKRTNKI